MRRRERGSWERRHAVWQRGRASLTDRTVMQIASDSGAPRMARNAVVRWLAGQGASAPLDDARLLVSELVANAVTHSSGGVIRLALLSMPGAVRVEVTNEGAWRYAPVRVPATSVSGRGLRIVDQLASRWGSFERADCTTVWFELDRV
jgi:anti-sigma regulatory factor (Ser/Thr protein kinase)